MDIIKIEKKAFVLDKDEKDKLIQCLQYCCHRFTQHVDSGIRKNKGIDSFCGYMVSKLRENEF